MGLFTGSFHHPSGWFTHTNNSKSLKVCFLIQERKERIKSASFKHGNAKYIFITYALIRYTISYPGKTVMTAYLHSRMPYTYFTLFPQNAS